MKIISAHPQSKQKENEMRKYSQLTKEIEENKIIKNECKMQKLLNQR